MADQALTWKAFREQEAEDQRRRKEDSDRPLRDAEAALRESNKQVFEFEKSEITARRPDPGFVLNESAQELKFAGADREARASEYVRAQSSLFVQRTPDFFPCPQNFQKITEYLTANGVNVPDAETFGIAYERLKLFGLLQERPKLEPAIETQPSPEPKDSETEPEINQGWDLDTGEPRTYTSHEINQMTAAQFKKAFRVWGNNAARFTRGYYE